MADHRASSKASSGTTSAAFLPMKYPKTWALGPLAVHPDGSPLQAGLLQSRGRSEAHCELCSVSTDLPGGPPALHRWPRSPRTASRLLEGHRCRLPVHPSPPKSGVTKEALIDPFFFSFFLSSSCSADYLSRPLFGHVLQTCIGHECCVNPQRLAPKQWRPPTLLD